MANRFLLVAVVIAALLALSIATPTPKPNYWWNVTQWDAGCSSLFCSYFFHVAAPMDSTYPGFTAYCAGKDTGSFIPCNVTDFQSPTNDIPYVSAKLKHQLDPTRPNGGALMGLSLEILEIEYVKNAFYKSNINVDDGHSVVFYWTGSHRALFNDVANKGKRFKVFPTGASPLQQ